MSTRYNTGNPIESTDVRDMSDNAKNFDEFSNSTSNSFIDRFGRDRQTIDGSIRKAGFQPASFDFLTGGTLVSGDRNKAVFNPSPTGDNNWYAWQGAFPKMISPNSTPATSGGLGENAWKPVTNNALAPTARESIRRTYAEAGLTLVAGSFEAGGTLTSASDVLLQESSGKAFGWSGAFPMVVAAGSAVTGYVDRHGAIAQRIVTTVAAIQSGVFKVGDVLEVSDRGGAKFNVIAGTANGFDKISAGAGLIAEYITSGAVEINCAHLGINTAATHGAVINRAMTLSVSSGVNRVFIPAGDFLIDQTLRIRSGVTLLGAGKEITKLTATTALAKEDNIITTANNPNYTAKCTSLTGPGSAFTYAYDVHISDLSVYGNHPVRCPLANSLSHVEQGCGIRFTSVLRGSITRVKVHQCVVHGISIDASSYFDDGNYNNNIAGGSRWILLSECDVSNSLIDDCITTHNSKSIVIEDCNVWNDGLDANMVWANNQHGIEIDEGSEDVHVFRCTANYLINGYQVKGHDTTYAARNVTFDSCIAERCVASFVTDHLDTMGGSCGGGNVSIINCSSINPENTRYQTSSIIFRPRHLWLRSYDGITVRNFKTSGSLGINELERGVTIVIIDGVRHIGGYGGVESGLTTSGMFLIKSSSTRGYITIRDVVSDGDCSIPIIRSGDSAIRGLSFERIKCRVQASIPLILVNLASLPTIADCTVLTSNIVCSFPNLGAAPATLLNAYLFKIDHGFASVQGSGNVATDNLVPPVIGWTFVNWGTGERWVATGSGSIGSKGVWTKLA